MARLSFVLEHFERSRLVGQVEFPVFGVERCCVGPKLRGHSCCLHHASGPSSAPSSLDLANILMILGR